MRQAFVFTIVVIGMRYTSTCGKNKILSKLLNQPHRHCTTENWKRSACKQPSVDGSLKSIQSDRVKLCRQKTSCKLRCPTHRNVRPIWTNCDSIYKEKFCNTQESAHLTVCYRVCYCYCYCYCLLLSVTESVTVTVTVCYRVQHSGVSQPYSLFGLLSTLYNPAIH